MLVFDIHLEHRRNELWVIIEDNGRALSSSSPIRRLPKQNTSTGDPDTIACVGSSFPLRRAVARTLVNTVSNIGEQLVSKAQALHILI
jgi:hypothetical protein